MVRPSGSEIANVGGLRGKADNICWASLTFLRPHPALLERQDCTLVTWYRSHYAPRAGGAYDSHHRTSGIACRTRRRGGVAARGARAATAGDAGGRGAQRRTARPIYGPFARVPCGAA